MGSRAVAVAWTARGRAVLATKGKTPAIASPARNEVVENRMSILQPSLRVSGLSTVDFRSKYSAKQTTCHWRPVKRETGPDPRVAWGGGNSARPSSPIRMLSSPSVQRASGEGPRLVEPQARHAAHHPFQAEMATR